MPRVSRRILFTTVVLGLMLSVASSMAVAQYTMKTLVKNSGTGKHIDRSWSMPGGSPTLPPPPSGSPIMVPVSPPFTTPWE